MPVCSPFAGDLGAFTLHGLGGDFKTALVAEMKTILKDASSDLKKAAVAASMSDEKVEEHVLDHALLGPMIMCRQSSCSKTLGCLSYAGAKSSRTSECERMKAYPEIYKDPKCETFESVFEKYHNDRKAAPAPPPAPTSNPSDQTLANTPSPTPTEWKDDDSATTASPADNSAAVRNDVKMEMTLKGVDFEKLIGSSVPAAFELAIKDAIAAFASVAADTITIKLSAGSVKIVASFTPPSSTALATILKKDVNELATVVVKNVQNVKGISAVTSDDKMEVTNAKATHVVVPLEATTVQKSETLLTERASRQAAGAAWASLCFGLAASRSL